MRPVREDILGELNRRIEQVGANGTLWVYFSGHGAAGPDGDALLLGADARATVLSMEGRSIKRSELVAMLQRSPAKRVVLVLDACCPGITRDGETLSDERMGAVNMELLLPKDPKVVVWSAGASEQTSGPRTAVKHGLFTCFLVAALSGWAGAAANIEQVHTLLAVAVAVAVAGRYCSPVHAPSFPRFSYTFLVHVSRTCFS